MFRIGLLTGRGRGSGLVLSGEPGFEPGLLQVAQLDAAVDAFDGVLEGLIGGRHPVGGEELGDIVAGGFGAEDAGGADED